MLFLTTKDKWLLVLIGSVPYVKGRTRLQKYGLLLSKEIFKNNNFFNDWEPDDFGGYSQQLAVSLKKLERRDLVRVTEVIDQTDEPVNHYGISEKGEEIQKDLISHNPSIFEKIKEIISFYHQKSLSSLLADVYEKYPELTLKSKIKAQVNKTRIQNESYLSTKYEIPTDHEKFEISSTVSAKEHVYNDEDLREKLAKSIGLATVPHLDPKSFERIRGVLAKNILSDDFDSIEIVKEIRGG
jgi:DNA-binding PadR family transcriptional regulator